MNWSNPITLSTPAGDTQFNPEGVDSDCFRLVADTSGFDMPAVRSVVDDRSQTDGAIVHDAFLGARRPTIVAEYLISAGTIEDRDAAFDALEQQLTSIIAADGTLTEHRPGGDRSVTVRCEIPLQSSGGPQTKRAVFGLVAAIPVWS